MLSKNEFLALLIGQLAVTLCLISWVNRQECGGACGDLRVLLIAPPAQLAAVN